MRIRRENRIGEKYGTLEIIGLSERKSHFIVKCSKCAEDVELNGKAEYEIGSGNLFKGILPCACSKAATWTTEQYLIRCRRRIENEFKNITAIEVLNKDLGVETKIQLYCNIHKSYFTTNFHVFLSNRYRGMCPTCEKQSTSKRKTKSICDTDVKQYPEGSYIWISPEKRPNNRGYSHGYYKYLHCGTCSNDIFVQEGLCDGIFKITGKRNKPCRCSDKFKYSDDMLKLLVDNYFQQNNHDNFEFFGIDINNPRRQGGRNLLLSCKQHGIYAKPYEGKDFKTTSITCPSCSDGGGYKTYKQGYFYILEIVSEDKNGFVGFGISNQPKCRLMWHKNTLEKHGFFIKNIQLFSGGGRTILLLESDVKRNFEIISSGIAGFIKEAVDITQLQSLLKYIDKYVDKVKKIDYTSFIE